MCYHTSKVIVGNCGSKGLSRTARGDARLFNVKLVIARKHRSTPTDNGVAVIENGRLAGSNGALRFIEVDQNSVRSADSIVAGAG